MDILDLRDKVTIGIPVYNEARFIRETLESAIIQGVTVSVSDNASTDGTSEICQEYADKGLIQYKLWTENQGSYVNGCFLANTVKTPYYMLLGGHDLLQPGYVDALFKKLDKDSKSVLCYTTVTKEIDAHGHLLRTIDDAILVDSMRSSYPFKRVMTIYQCQGYMAIQGLTRSLFLKKALQNIPKPCIMVDYIILSYLASWGQWNYITSHNYIRREFRSLELLDVWRRHNDMLKMSQQGQRKLFMKYQKDVIQNIPSNKLIKWYYLRQWEKTSKVGWGNYFVFE
ncbi:MAG: glycosyltransferase family 2 protein [Synergistaceae bacterium]|nr:glycosyltransferase family 2 protein [Synergistaceae bacterium]